MHRLMRVPGRGVCTGTARPARVGQCISHGRFPMTDPFQITLPIPAHQVWFWLGLVALAAATALTLWLL